MSMIDDGTGEMLDLVIQDMSRADRVAKLTQMLNNEALSPAVRAEAANMISRLGSAVICGFPALNFLAHAVAEYRENHPKSEMYLASMLADQIEEARSAY